MKLVHGLLSMLAAAQASGDGLVSPEIAEALQLRARLGVEDGASDYAIFVQSIAAHHLIEEYTRVATRGGDGLWTIVSIGERRPGLVDYETLVIPLERRILDSEQGDRLYRLLRRPGLSAQLPSTHDHDTIGAPSHTMEIVTPTSRTVVRWSGRLRGRVGQIADVVMGRRAPD